MLKSEKANQTPYEILEIKPKASDDEIKKAYRRLILRYHPDKSPLTGIDSSECEKRTKAINQAYDTLSRTYKVIAINEDEERARRERREAFENWAEETLQVVREELRRIQRRVAFLEAINDILAAIVARDLNEVKTHYEKHSKILSDTYGEFLLKEDDSILQKAIEVSDPGILGFLIQAARSLPSDDGTDFRTRMKNILNDSNCSSDRELMCVLIMEDPERVEEITQDQYFMYYNNLKLTSDILNYIFDFESKHFASFSFYNVSRLMHSSWLLDSPTLKLKHIKTIKRLFDNNQRYSAPYKRYVLDKIQRSLANYYMRLPRVQLLEDDEGITTIAKDDSANHALSTATRSHLFSLIVDPEPPPDLIVKILKHLLVTLPNLLTDQQNSFLIDLLNCLIPHHIDKIEEPLRLLANEGLSFESSLSVILKQAIKAGDNIKVACLVKLGAAMPRLELDLFDDDRTTFDKQLTVILSYITPEHLANSPLVNEVIDTIESAFEKPKVDKRVRKRVNLRAKLNMTSDYWKEVDVTIQEYEYKYTKADYLLYFLVPYLFTHSCINTLADEHHRLVQEKVALYNEALETSKTYKNVLKMITPIADMLSAFETLNQREQSPTISQVKRLLEDAIEIHPNVSNFWGIKIPLLKKFSQQIGDLKQASDLQDDLTLLNYIKTKMLSFEHENQISIK